MSTNNATVTDADPAGIIFFDFDGVLNGKHTWQAVHETLEVSDNASDNYAAYNSGNITFSEWVQKDASLWADTPASKFYEATEKLDLTQDIESVITELRQRGYRVGIVSAGVAQLIKAVIDTSLFDFVIGNDVDITDGTVTGSAVTNVVSTEKYKNYRRICESYGVSTAESVRIGDSQPDLAPEERGLKIALNPRDDETREAGDVVIESRELSCVVHAVNAWSAGRST